MSTPLWCSVLLTWAITTCLWTYYNGIFSGVKFWIWVEKPQEVWVFFLLLILLGLTLMKWDAWSSYPHSISRVSPVLGVRSWWGPGVREAEKTMTFWMTFATWRKWGLLRRIISEWMFSRTGPCYSLCGLRIGSISITWQRIRNAASQMPSSLIELDSGFYQDPWWFIWTLIFEKHCFDENVFLILETW